MIELGFNYRKRIDHLLFCCTTEYLLWWKKDTIVEYKFTKNHQLNLSFVSSEEMQLLNKTYRNKDKPTNVLSFELPENFPVGDEKTLIGEIALCEEIIYEESKKYKKIFENRLKHMIIHGLLHLIGFDHIKKEEENKMESIE